MDRPPYNNSGLRIDEVYSMLAQVGKTAPPLQSLSKSQFQHFVPQQIDEIKA